MLSVTNYSYIRTHVQQQADNSAQHWSTIVLPINTVATAGAWILADRHYDGRRVAGFFEVQVIQLGYCEYWLPNNSSCGDCYCLAAAQHVRLAAARPAGGRTAQIFSDCAITKYLNCATAFTVNTSMHPVGRAITAN